MGRGRAAGAFIAVLISGALIDVARGGELVECEPQRVTGDGRYWAYRIIDGRECWYPGRPGKPKNELFWARGISPSARQPVDQPEAATEPSEPPSNFVGAPPKQPETIEAVPEQWRATAADQLLAFTCCWPELDEPTSLLQPKSQPPAWPLSLLPLGLYALWWIARPRRVLQAVRAEHADRVAARRLTRLPSTNGRDDARRERQKVSAGVVERERPNASRDNKKLSSCRQYSTALDHSATSLFVLPINEQQQVSLASLVDAPDPVARPNIRSRLVTG
jgi:hypothetical protein